MDNKKPVREATVTVSAGFIITLIYSAAFGFTLFEIYNKILEVPPLHTGGTLSVFIYIAEIIFFLNIIGAYRIDTNRFFNIFISNVICLIMANTMGYLELSLVNRSFLSVIPIIILTCFDILVALIWSLAAGAIYDRVVPVREALLVYGDKLAEETVYKLLERSDRYRIVETHKYEEDENGSNIEEVEQVIGRFSTIIISRVDSSVRNDLLKYCYDHDIDVILPPRISDIMIRGAKDLNQFDSPFISCRNSSMSSWQLFVKRLFDIIGSLFAIIILGPLMLITALCIRLYDNGSILFTQKRVTRDGKVFDIYKFRSMVPDAEKQGEPIKATEDDPRITPIGKLIRRLRIDELPQFFNILKGDMSLVGPRPERIENCEEYEKKIPEFHYRNKVKAGLTGYAQVMGKYNTTPYDKLLLDLTYIQHFSFFLDFKILMMTFKIVFMKESTEGFKSETETNERKDQK